MDDIVVNLKGSTETLALPDPELLTYYKDESHRILWFEGEVEQEHLEFIRKILQWNQEDIGIKPEKRKPIKIFFFSPGGSLDVNNAIIDTISLSKTPVWGINVSMCCSAAAFIYLSCHRRFMLPQAYFVYHQGSGAFSGDYLTVISQLQAYQEQVAHLSEVMKKYTKYTEAEIEEGIAGEWYIFAKEALEKGVCDEIITDLDVLLDKKRR
jgi:ATP-dependent protease ClpP protease subunit